MTNTEINDKLRQDSGLINTSDPLVAILYDLLRDGPITPGQLEEAVREIEMAGQQEYLLSNGWLALYAKNIAARIEALRK